MVRLENWSKVANSWGFNGPKLNQKTVAGF